MFTYNVSWEQAPVLQRILQLDDIFIVVITHYKQISGSEVTQWQTHDKCFPKRMSGETPRMQQVSVNKKETEETGVVGDCKTWNFFLPLFSAACLTSKIIKHLLKTASYLSRIWPHVKNNQTNKRKHDHMQWFQFFLSLELEKENKN